MSWMHSFMSLSATSGLFPCASPAPAFPRGTRWFLMCKRDCGPPSSVRISWAPSVEIRHWLSWGWLLCWGSRTGLVFDRFYQNEFYVFEIVLSDWEDWFQTSLCTKRPICYLKTWALVKCVWNRFEGIGNRVEDTWQPAVTGSKCLTPGLCYLQHRLDPCWIHIRVYVGKWGKVGLKLLVTFQPHLEETRIRSQYLMVISRDSTLQNSVRV